MDENVQDPRRGAGAWWVGVPLPRALSPPHFTLRLAELGPGPAQMQRCWVEGGEPLGGSPRSPSPPMGAPGGQSQAPLPQGLVVALAPGGSRRTPLGLGPAEADPAQPASPAAAATGHQSTAGRAPLLSEGYRLPAASDRPSVKTGLREATSWLPHGQPCLKGGRRGLKGRERLPGPRGTRPQPPRRTKGGGDESLLPRGETHLGRCQHL